MMVMMTVSYLFRMGMDATTLPHLFVHSTIVLSISGTDSRNQGYGREQTDNTLKEFTF